MPKIPTDINLTVSQSLPYLERLIDDYKKNEVWFEDKEIVALVVIRDYVRKFTKKKGNKK